MKRIVAIIDAEGQLGGDLVEAFSDEHTVIPLSFSSGIDITKPEVISKAIKDSRATVVINTAAFHNVPECEKDPEKSYTVNAIGAYNVAAAAVENNAVIVYIGTDYAFDGTKESYSENDATNPLNVYGASKLAGEHLTKIVNSNHYIVRTSSLFGKRPSGKGHNFVQLMIKLAQEQGKVSVVDDQFMSPTYTTDLAQKIEELITRDVPRGIYHITNSGSCSWYEFAREIFKVYEIDAPVEAIKSSDRPSPVNRPLKSVLRNDALQKAGLSLPRSWQEALIAYSKS